MYTTSTVHTSMCHAHETKIRFTYYKKYFLITMKSERIREKERDTTMKTTSITNKYNMKIKRRFHIEWRYTLLNALNSAEMEKTCNGWIHQHRHHYHQ